jgi:putative transposase
VNGRKRHLLVDSQGLLLEAVVHSANIQDCHGAKLVLAQGKHRQGGRWLRRLKLIWVDNSYGGQLVEWVKKAYGWTLEVIEHLDSHKHNRQKKAFVVLPRRWVIERTFGWLTRYRRLARDYEGLLLTSEILIYAAMSHLMLRRLARNVGS